MAKKYTKYYFWGLRDSHEFTKNFGAHLSLKELNEAKLIKEKLRN